MCGEFDSRVSLCLVFGRHSLDTCITIHTQYSAKTVVEVLSNQKTNVTWISQSCSLSAHCSNRCRESPVIPQSVIFKFNQ